MKFFKPKIEYIDILAKWRKIKCWDYNMFDKVIITDGSGFKSKNIWKEWVIIEYKHEEFEKWNVWYTIILENGEIIYKWETWIKFKKSYWEFQEEFEAMEEVEKKAKELQELEEQMKKKAWELAEYYKKASKITENNIQDIYKKIK